MHLLHFLPLITSALASTTYYINKVPAYSSLSACAVKPLSTIVRDMEQGCGDGGKYVSYSCFCTASSSAMDGKISKAVAADCVGNEEVTSALEVFASYCAMGSNGSVLTSVPASATGSAANATVSTFTSYSNSSSSTSSSSAASGSQSASLSSTTSSSAPAGTSSAASPSNTSGAGRFAGSNRGLALGGIAFALGLAVAA